MVTLYILSIRTDHLYAPIYNPRQYINSTDRKVQSRQEDHALHYVL